jgi:monoamine oxidase
MSGSAMQAADIVIIGGGVSGLYAAWRLQQQGITDWRLIEARDTLGGRILSVPASAPGVAQAPQAGSATNRTNCFDLGPSWFWPGCQQQLDRLVQQLGLERFEQYETGDMVVERSPHSPPVRMRGYVNSPPSMRLVGGMGSLIDALHQCLDRTRIVTGQSVQRMRCTGGHVELDCEGSSGQATTWRAGRVLLATPPRLAMERIEFTPALPVSLAQAWQATATWMAPHAKYFAVYERPFWREQGLSGEARSACGPLVEIHDASIPGGSAALFGFFGLPASLRQSVTEEVLRSHCRAQLARLFGPEAAHPRAELFKDWAVDPCTATAADGDSAGQHPQAPARGTCTGPWAGRLTCIGSEWSPQFPGYVAGAIEAASLGLETLLSMRES